MTDADLYVAAAEAAGESHRGLARRILDVDERTGRRWRAGEQALSGPARQLCRILIAHPEIAREIAVDPSV